MTLLKCIGCEVSIDTEREEFIPASEEELWCPSCFMNDFDKDTD